MQQRAMFMIPCKKNFFIGFLCFGFMAMVLANLAKEVFLSLKF